MEVVNMAMRYVVIELCRVHDGLMQLSSLVQAETGVSIELAENSSRLRSL